MKNEYAIAILIAVFGLGAVIGQSICHANYKIEAEAKYVDKLEDTINCMDIGGKFINGECVIKWED